MKANPALTIFLFVGFFNAIAHEQDWEQSQIQTVFHRG